MRDCAVFILVRLMKRLERLNQAFDFLISPAAIIDQKSMVGCLPPLLPTCCVFSFRIGVSL
jgi:hypothetical protein